MRDQVAIFRRLATLCLSGSAALAGATWMCFGLGLNLPTTAFAYLIVVVLLSLADSLISSVLFSVVATACLNVFFVAPRLTLQVNDAEDLTALAAFLITALLVTGLVRRLRHLGNTQGEQARLVNLTTEEALRYSEHRYTNLFQAMAASFWELDFSGVAGLLRSLRKSGVTDFHAYLREHPEFVREMMRRTRVVDVNDRSVAMFGRGNKAELLGNVEPFWPEESAMAYAEGVLAGAAGKHSYSVECRLRRIDGTLFDALFTAAYPPETMGKGSLMVGVIDITARKRAFAELERSEQRYRYLFNHMPIALWQLNAGGLASKFRQLPTWVGISMSIRSF